MRKLLLLTLCIPFLSYGQKIEFTEMAGIGFGGSPGFSNNFVDIDGGFTNRLSASYYFSQHFSIGAVYELNRWNENSFALGAVAEVQFRHVYFGADLSYLKISTTYLKVTNYFSPNTNTSTDVITYSPTVLFDVHFGLRQRLARRFYIKEQIGLYSSIVKSEDNYETPPLVKQFGYFNFLAGVAYRFPVKSISHPE